MCCMASGIRLCARDDAVARPVRTNERRDRIAAVFFGIKRADRPISLPQLVVGAIGRNGLNPGHETTLRR